MKSSPPARQGVSLGSRAGPDCRRLPTRRRVDGPCTGSFRRCSGAAASGYGIQWIYIGGGLPKELMDFQVRPDDSGRVRVAPEDRGAEGRTFEGDPTEVDDAGAWDRLCSEWWDAFSPNMYLSDVTGTG